MQQANERTNVIQVNPGLFYGQQRERNMTFEGCLEGVYILKLELWILTCYEEVPFLYSTLLPWLCVLTVSVSSSLSLVVYLLEVFLVSFQYSFLLALHSPVQFIHPNYDYLINSGGDTFRPLIQAVSLGRKPCHLSILNENVSLTQNKTKQPATEIPFIRSICFSLVFNVIF